MNRYINLNNNEVYVVVYINKDDIYETLTDDTKININELDISIFTKTEYNEIEKMFGELYKRGIWLNNETDYGYSSYSKEYKEASYFLLYSGLKYGLEYLRIDKNINKNQIVRKIYKTQGASFNVFRTWIANNYEIILKHYETIYK